MGRKPTDKNQEEFLKYLRSGRDEMNLLEHSISSASKEVDRNTRSLLFTRDDRDPETGAPVKRTWDVSFSGKYGRPTSTDDDVFVACMKLSAAQNFAAARVEFTRYEICQILGWSVCGKAYKAIDDAFNRLAGVLIVATNYWYDNQSGIWVDRKFGVIDDVFLYQREKYDRAKKAAGGKNPQSWFRWSDVMQESFAAGYVRKLDLELYLSLANPVARKLYRYLGKHFWNRSRHAIDLKVLCHEKLGYSQSVTMNAQLKRKVEPAIKELEAKGIYGLSHEFNASYGKCSVLFVAKTKSNEKPAPKRVADPLVERLTALGIDPGDAFDAVARLAAARIVEDIEHVEFLAKSGAVKKSKHGLLATMLKTAEPWARPAGFVSSVAKNAAAERVAENLARAAAAKSLQEQQRRQMEAEAEAAFAAFMDEFVDDAERTAFRDEALRSNALLRNRYREAEQNDETELMAIYADAAMRAAWKTRQREPAVQKSIRF